MSNRNNLIGDGKTRVRRQSSMQPHGQSMNADLQDAYKGEQDESYSRGRPSSKPRSQKSHRRPEASSKALEGAETHKNAGYHGLPSAIKHQSQRRIEELRAASLKEINEVQSNVHESSMDGQDLEQDPQGKSRQDRPGSSQIRAEDGSTQRRDSSLDDTEPRRVDRSFQGPSKSILVHDNNKIQQLEALISGPVSPHPTIRHQSTTDALAGIQGQSVSALQRQGNSAHHGTETKSDEGQQIRLDARISSGTYAIKFSDGVLPVLPRQRVVVARTVESPLKSTLRTSPLQTTVPSPFMIPAAMNTGCTLRSEASREAHHDEAAMKHLLPQPNLKQPDSARRQQHVEIQIQTSPQSPIASSKALPTSQFCPHRSFSPIRSKNSQFQQALDKYEVQALAQEKCLQNSGFKSKKSPFINSIKKKRVLHTQHQGSSGSLQVQGNGMGSQDQLQQLSQDRLRQPSLLQRDSVDGSMQQEFSYRGGLDDNVVVRDANEQPRGPQHTLAKTGMHKSLQKKAGSNFANLTLNEDSQGTLPIMASKLQEPSFQLQTQLLSTQSIHLEKKDSNSLKQTGFNTNSLRHLEQTIMNKRGALQNHGMPEKVKVLDITQLNGGRQLAESRNSLQVRKLASSGSADTSGDLQLSDHGGDRRLSPEREADARGSGAKRNSELELHVEDPANASSMPDPIRTLSNNASKHITVDPSRNQLITNHEQSRLPRVEIVDPIERLLQNSSMDKLETPELTADMEPRGEAKLKARPPATKVKTGPQSILDQKLWRLSKEARIRQKRLSKEHDIGDPMLTIRSFSQDSKGSARNGDGVSPSGLELQQEVRAPAHTYVISSPALVDKILASDYAERKGTAEAANEKIQVIHTQATTASGRPWRQEKAPLKVKEGNFKGLQDIRQAQAAQIKSPPPFLAQKKRSFKVDISAETSPQRLQRGRREAASRDHVNSTQMLEIKGFDHEFLPDAGLQSQVMRTGANQSVYQSAFKIGSQRSGHLAGHISSHKAFSPGNIQKSLEKLMSTSPTGAEDRVQSDRSAHNAADFKGPFRETTATLNANIAHIERGIQGNLSPNYDILPTMALSKNQMHSTSVRNMVADIEQKLDGPIHWTHNPARNGNPHLHQRSQLGSLYQPDPNAAASSHLRQEKTLGAQTSLTNINMRDSNKLDISKSYNEILASGEGNIHDQATDRHTSTKHNADLPELEMTREAMVEMLPGILAVPEAKTSTRRQQNAERPQSEGTAGEQYTEHSKETLESPIGPSPLGTSGRPKRRSGDGAAEQGQNFQIAEGRHRNEIMKKMFERSTKAQSPRASQDELNEQGSPMPSRSPRHAVLEKSARHALFVNTDTANLGQQKSELTLRHSQSSDWRQSPMTFQHSHMGNTQRHFSPRHRDYKQVLNGKYLVKQAASQDSRAFLDSIRDMKEVLREQKNLIRERNPNAISQEKINTEAYKQTFSQETLVLQAEPAEGPALGHDAPIVPLVPKIEMEERKDALLGLPLDDTFYKSKGALINRLPRNHNFGGVLKENKLKKPSKTGKTTEQAQPKSVNQEQKENIKKFHRKLLKEFNSQFSLNLGASQPTEEPADGSKKVVSFDKVEQGSAVGGGKHQRSGRVIALSRSKTALFEKIQQQQAKRSYDIATPQTPGTQIQVAIDALKNAGRFPALKEVEEFPPTEPNENCIQSPAAQKNPTDAMSYNVGIINIVKFGNRMSPSRRRMESKDANDLTAQTEYRQAPDQNDLNTNFANFQMEGTDHNQAVNKGAVSIATTSSIHQVRVNGQAALAGKQQHRIQENNMESTQKEESDLKTPQHGASSSPMRSRNKSPSAQTPGQTASFRPSPSDFTPVAEHQDQVAESLLDTVMRMDQQNFQNSQGSEALNQHYAQNPESEIHDVRKASIAFTGVGPESVYAEDHRLTLIKAMSEFKKDGGLGQRQKSIDQASSTLDRQGLDPQAAFIGNIAVRHDSPSFQQTLGAFSPHFQNSMILQNNTLNQDLKNATIHSVHSDENHPWWNSATSQAPAGRGLRSKGHPSITEGDSELTSPKSPIKARFYPPFRPQQIKIDNRNNGAHPELPPAIRELQDRDSNDWSQLQRVLANGKDPSRLLRQQELDRTSLLPPIVQAQGTTPTNMSSTLTPPDKHQRNLSCEDPALFHSSKKYLNKLSAHSTKYGGLKKGLPASTLHSTIQPSDLGASRGNLLASHLAHKKARHQVLLNREQLNRTIAAQTLRTEALQTMSQIEELTKNMRRLKPYRRRAQASMLSPAATLAGASGRSSLKAFISGTIERDVGKSERKIEKIQREFREFEEQLAFTAASQVKRAQPEDLLASTSGSFVVYQDEARPVLPASSMPPIQAGHIYQAEGAACWQGR